MKQLFHILLALALFSSFCFAQKIIRVPGDYATIKAAIAVAVDRDTVLVSEGTYVENLRINKKILLASLYIVDGQESHIANTIIDGHLPPHPDSASAVYFSGDLDTLSGIVGFTITGGTGSVRYVALDNIFGREGGGINVLEVPGIRISHNIVKNNSLTLINNVKYTWGGGISITCSNRIIAGQPNYCIVEHNQVYNNKSIGGSGEGGGVEFWTNGRVKGNRIISNESNTLGGGINCGQGINVVFSENYIKGNRAISSTAYGGGVGTYAAYGTTPSLTFINNIFDSNTAYASAHCDFRAGDYIFVNNTIVNATSTTGAAIRFYKNPNYSTVGRFMNTILWNSTPMEIALSTGSVVTMNYCLVKGGYTGTGNISDAPKFTAQDTLYSLNDSSRCIGKGMSSATVSGLTLYAPSSDYLGLSRPRPVASNPDLGAIESPLANPIDGIIEELAGSIPIQFQLNQNYPNPFNPSTTIRFSLPYESHVRLTIFNVLGQHVAQLVDRDLSSGMKEVRWEAQSSPGIYFYRLEAVSQQGDRFIETREMVLLK